ncbi:B3 domain-containing protein Os04g0386900-like [Solanum dulcamara]|uniref:B3 domain-containing protein Os04g0386900-like n=1 Tax=Solanum dulcamara TaxID=45834 RepID=UPI002485BD1A|nr:B3 domain-containing protein Os04g0386900-like [Solanum dulcamara]
MEGGSSSEQKSNQKGKSIVTESTESAEIKNDDYWPLSEKPYVDMILTKSSVKPIYQLYLPKKMNKELPFAGALVVLTCGRKKWDLFYGGAKSTYKFSSGWRKFADDNNLKEGDGLVFELSECSTTKIELRVQILRGDLPAELIPEDVEGKNSDNPIIID